jgi:hypothetical protein
LIDFHIKFRQKVILFLIIIFITPPVGFLTYVYNNFKEVDHIQKVTHTEVKQPVLPTIDQASYDGGLDFFGLANDVKLIKDDKIAIIHSRPGGIYIVNTKPLISSSILSVFKTNKEKYESIKKILLSKDEKTIYALDADGVFSVDISDLKNPKLLNYLPIHEFHLGSQQNISISDNNSRLYITGMHGMFIADISQKTDIKIIGKFHNSTMYFNSVEIDKDTLYLLDGHGIDIVDMSDINNLKLVGSYPTIAHAVNITLSNNKQRAYVTGSSSDVEILNLRDKLNPKPLGSFTTDGSSLNLDIQENEKIIYSFNSNYNMQIFDVSYTYDPKLIQTIQFNILKRNNRNVLVYNHVLSKDEETLYVAYGTSHLVTFEMPILKE